MSNLPKLTPRLKAVADLVRPGGVIADIGTDHAYLPVYLTKSGCNPKAFACDIKKGPLERAKKTIAAYDAAEYVSPVLCDGLSGVAYADDIILAGMGGELIANILAQCEFVKDPRVHLILQPMTAIPQLRSYLCLAGFEIKNEMVVKEYPKLYLIIEASYTGLTFRPDDYFCLTGLLPRTGGPLARLYLLREAAKLKKIAEGLRVSAERSEESANFEAMADRIAQAAEKLSCADQSDRGESS